MRWVRTPTGTLGFYAAVLYDFNSRGRFQPFIGGGAGFNQVEMEVEGLGDESDARLSALATAGIGVVLSSSLVGDLTYRYQFTPGLQHAWSDADPDPVSGFVETTSLATDLRQHAIMAGLRYTMNPANSR